MATRKRRRNMDSAILYEIEAKALENWTPSQIHTDLERKLKAQDRLVEVPSLRTVQRIVKDVEIRDTSGTWRPADDEAEDARLILEVLANIIIYSSGKKRSFSKAEARWVLKIRKLASDADAVKVWRLARTYMVYESQGNASTEDLDAYLAFAPWRNKNHLLHYVYAAVKGWIPVSPRFHDLYFDVTAAFGLQQHIGRQMSLLELPPEQIEKMASEHRQQFTQVIADIRSKGDISEEVIKDLIKYLKQGVIGVDELEE